MEKRELVAPPIGTIYRLSHIRHYTRLREDEYWQVERRTEKTVWLRQLVTNTAGEPILGMTRTDVPLRQCRFVLRTFDFARIPVQGGFVNDTIIPCRLHKNGGLYIRGLQVHRYHGEVHDPRYDS